MTLPQDPFILLSWVNTQLRDNYPDFQSLCDDLGLDSHDIIKSLAQAGFEYDCANNKFW